uniref:hypothetical protein n=1 Tax=Desertihabitans aurantiacus TaxID=2282477 RepID=UPI0018E5992E
MSEDHRTPSASGARDRLRELLGLTDVELSGPAVVEPDTEAPAPPGGRAVRLVTGHGTVVPSFLLQPPPERSNGAGVVLVAGHGRGIDDLVRSDPADGYHDGLAHKLVDAGFTVLCPEMLSFGRRRLPRPAGA